MTIEDLLTFLELLFQLPDLTAIVAGNDPIAIGVMSATRELGLV